MLTDPIADMLTRVRNANRALHDTASMPTSRMKEEIARILEQEGYIRGFKVEPGEPVSTLVVELKFGKDRLPRVLGGLGTAIMSTSTGVITNRQAAERGVGGEVIAFVW